MKILLILSLAVLFGSLRGEVLCWKGSSLALWQAKRNVKCTPSGKVLKITFDRDDPQIEGPEIRLDPSKFNCFSITYRAKNLKGTQGEMYFAHAPDDFSSRKYWLIPRLKADGKWHTVTVNAKALYNVHNWFEGGMIKKLRLDPVNKAGGVMEISEIKFFKK